MTFSFVKLFANMGKVKCGQLANVNLALMSFGNFALIIYNILIFTMSLVWGQGMLNTISFIHNPPPPEKYHDGLSARTTPPPHREERLMPSARENISYYASSFERNSSNFPSRVAPFYSGPY